MPIYSKNLRLIRPFAPVAEPNVICSLMNNLHAMDGLEQEGEKVEPRPEMMEMQQEKKEAYFEVVQDNAVLYQGR